MIQDAGTPPEARGKPTGSRRYSRLETCATTALTARFASARPAKHPFPVDQRRAQLSLLAHL